jgi:hypothetical protein
MDAASAFSANSTTAEVEPAGVGDAAEPGAEPSASRFCVDERAQSGAVSGKECRSAEAEGEEAHAVRMPAHTTPTSRAADADITDPGERKERIEVLSRSECEVAEEPPRTLYEKGSQ